MKKILISSALLAGVLSYAGGFKVSLQGVKQLAMAHTSAHAEDASVGFFNPAGISFIPSKLSIVAGGFGAKSEVEFQNVSTMTTTKTDNPIGTPIYAAVAYKISPTVSAGFSFTTPYGNTVQWPNNWQGSEIIEKLELKSYFFQPMLSVKLAPWISLGGSYIYVKGKVDWTQAISSLNGSLNLYNDKASGSGYSFGFYMQPDSDWDVSISYRSPIDMKADPGTATFNISPALYSNPKLNIPASGKDNFSAVLPLAEEFMLGVSYKVTPKWMLSADFNYQGWSKYSKLVLDFEHATVGNTSDPTIKSIPKKFQNSKVFRVGSQYMITDKFAGRVGYYWDESPYSDQNWIPDTPSFNAHVITGGFGYKFGRLGIDAAASYTFGDARKVENSYYNLIGQARAKVLTFGLGLSYNAF
ncbi:MULTISPECIES: OmpP1/FadL family transporter [Amniculibacterium]|jgi:long-chain fatty acid transport protein|uniref:OmpP1/FadL family transporter n=1 Tax=Amniculibacterium TaxID=2715289 RepID=UPI000F59ADE8|nr:MULTISPECIES: outer membrane protein transport protein [Amniculibacterium]